MLNRKSGGLHEAAYLLGFFAILSQLLGLLRDRILAGSFGAGIILDTYYAAFRIPDLIFVIIASTVSISVLIPFLNARLGQDLTSAKKFVSDMMSVFLIVIGLFSILIFFFMPKLVGIIFPGFENPEQIKNVILLSRIMLLSPILLGLSNLFSSVVQLYDKFFVYALSPLLYNIGIIFGALFLYPIFGITGLGIGVVLGAILHFAILIPVVISSGYSVKLSFNIDWKSVKEVVLVSLPRTLALSSQQLSLLILLSIASLVGIGSISVFNLSFNIQAVPLSIIGISYSAAAFPALSRLFGIGEKEKFFAHIAAAVRHIIFWSIPATILFIVLRAQVIRTAYGSGEFGWEATRLTAAMLAIFVLSSIAQSLVSLFVRAYYAAGNTRKPLFINLLSALSIILLAFFLLDIFKRYSFFQYFLENLLKVSDISGTAVLVLPLAYTIGMFINLLLFWFAFQSDFRDFGRGIYRSFFHILSAAIVAGFVANRFLNVFDDFLNINTLVGIFSQGFFSGILGILAGYFILKLLGNRELEEIKTALHHKFWKSKVIIPEHGDI
jgi:putative peptidoglycan lipid II flippase